MTDDTTREEQYAMDMLELRTEFDKLILRAQKRAVEDKLTQYYKRLIDEKMFDRFNEAAQPVLERLGELQDVNNNIFDVKNGKSNWCFFTINFKPGFSMLDVEAVMEQFCKKYKMLRENDYVYSVEQRTEDGVAEEGVHAHILFPKKLAPSKILPEVNKFFFDKYVGTHAALDFKFTNDQVAKLKYILGIKEKAKMPKVYQDRRFKDNYKMPWWRAQGDAMFDAIKEIVSSRGDEFESQMEHIV